MRPVTRTISIKRLFRQTLPTSAWRWPLWAALSGCAALAPDALELGSASSGERQTDGARPDDGGAEKPAEGGQSIAPDGGDVGAPDAAPGDGGPVAEPVVTIVVEAESYDVIDPNMTARSFYPTAKGIGGPSPDPDGSHAGTASGAKYLEVLPDTRVTGTDPFDDAVFEEAGTGPIVSYFISFPVPGTYYLWVRGFSTGTEDETVHVGLDRDWLTSVIAKLCSDGQGWQWASHERVDKFSCGNIGELRLEVPSAGLHTVSFAAREDGFELDKWLLTTDATFVPRDKGPEETPR